MIKLIHISCAVLTIIMFTFRGILMWLNSGLLQHKILKILPHCIDAVLLVSGLIMVLNYYNHITSHPWLILKILLVVIYIVAGSIALKYGRTRTVRIAALFTAWGLLVIIVALAITRSMTLGF